MSNTASNSTSLKEEGKKRRRRRKKSKIHVASKSSILEGFGMYIFLGCFCFVVVQIAIRLG